MKRWTVTVYASEEIEVEADTNVEAEKLAAEESNFMAVDYCRAEEIREEAAGEHRKY
jgi:hypothetical protein